MGTRKEKIRSKKEKDLEEKKGGITNIAVHHSMKIPNGGIHNTNVASRHMRVLKMRRFEIFLFSCFRTVQIDMEAIKYLHINMN